jgi:hypothetical protein
MAENLEMFEAQVSEKITPIMQSYGFEPHSAIQVRTGPHYKKLFTRSDLCVTAYYEPAERHGEIRIKRSNDDEGIGVSVTHLLSAAGRNFVDYFVIFPISLETWFDGLAALLRAEGALLFQRAPGD